MFGAEMFCLCFDNRYDAYELASVDFESRQRLNLLAVLSLSGVVCLCDTRV